MKRTLSKLLSILLAVAVTIATINIPAFANEKVEEIITENEAGQEIIEKEDYLYDMSEGSVSLNYIYDHDKAVLCSPEGDDIPPVDSIEIEEILNYDFENFDFVVIPKEGYTVKGVSIQNPDGSRNSLLRAGVKSSSLSTVKVYTISLGGKPYVPKNDINIVIDVVKIEKKTISLQYKDVSESDVEFYISGEKITVDSDKLEIENSKEVTAKWKNPDKKIIRAYKVVGEEKEELPTYDFSESYYGTGLGLNYEDCTVIFEAVDVYELDFKPVLSTGGSITVNSYDVLGDDAPVTSHPIAENAVSEFTASQSRDMWLEINYNRAIDEYGNDDSRFVYMTVYETVNGVKKEIKPVKGADLWDMNWIGAIYPVKYESDKIITIEVKESPKVKINFEVNNARVISMNDWEPISDSVIGYIGNNYYFHVETDEGYVVDNIELKDADSGMAGFDEYEGAYYVQPSKLSVTAVVNVIPEPKRIYLSNYTEYEAKIVTNNKVVRVDESDEYIVKYNASEVEIEVLVKNSDEETAKEPKVGFVDADNQLYSFASTKQEKQSEGTMYSYLVPEAVLTENTTIFVESIKEDNVSLEIKCNEFISDYVVVNNKKYLQPNEEGKYNVKYGDTIDLQIYALQGYCAGNVSVDYDGSAPDFSKMCLEQNKTVKIPVRGNIAISIESMLAGGVVVRNSSDVIMKPSNIGSNIAYYNLPTDDYFVTFEVGGNKLRIFEPARPYGYAMEFIDEYTGMMHLENGLVKIGRCSFDVELPSGKRFTYSISSTPTEHLNGIEIVSKGRYLNPTRMYGFEKDVAEGEIECPIDMDTLISIRPVSEVNGKKVARARSDMSLLKYEVSKGAEDKVEVVERSVSTAVGNYSIRTKGTVGKGTVTFYTDYKGERKDLAIINVNVTEPTELTEQQVRIYKELNDADDTTVTLAVREPLRITKSAVGKQYFKVVSKEKGSEEIKTFYFLRETPPYKDYPDGASDAQIEAIDKENQIIGDNFRQYIRCKVSDLMPGMGKIADYDLDVSMIWVMPGDTLDSPIYESKVLSVTASTKEPVFETKLSLQKKQTTVYTGQKDVMIAVAGFSKTTVNKGVTALDVTDIAQEQKLTLSVSEDGKVIYASANDNTQKGKHQILVYPVKSETMYVEPVKMDVNVIQGINNISLINVPSSIYKKAGSVATVQIGAVLNEGGQKPASNKLTYELLGAGGGALYSDVVTSNNGSEHYTDESQAGNITISSSGKINISKNFQITDANNGIRVKVTASDYEGNTTQAISDVIRLEMNPLEIGNIRLLQWDSTKQTYVSKGILDSKGVLILTSDEVDNTMVAVFEKGAVDKSTYSKSEMSKIALNLSDVSITCANKSLLQNKEDGNLYLTATNILNAVPIKVTTLDGGKKSATQKISVTYRKPEKLYLSVSDNVVSNNETVTFDGHANTVIDLRVLENNPDGSDKPVRLAGLTQYKLTAAKGGKIVSQDIKTGSAKAIVTAENAVFTLEDANKNKTTVTIKNNTYNTNAAPSVKTTQSFKCDTDMEQSLAVTFASKNYNFDGKYAIIETDAVAAYSVKNKTAYEMFENAVTEINEAEPVKIVKSGEKATINLNAKDVPVSAGKYKVAIIFGNVNDGKFIPDAKVAYTTISVAKPKVIKGTFKPVTKFTLDPANNVDSAVLLASGTALKSYEFKDIYNVNVGGKENNFDDYFEIDTDYESGKQIIRLASGLSDEDISYLKSAAGKKDLQGYLSYTATYGDDGYGNSTTSKAIVKIQIVIK